MIRLRVYVVGTAALLLPASAQAPATLDALFERIKPQSRALIECFEDQTELRAIKTCDPSVAVVEQAMATCVPEEIAYRKAVVELGGSERFVLLAEQIIAKSKDGLRPKMQDGVDKLRERAKRC